MSRTPEKVFGARRECGGEPDGMEPELPDGRMTPVKHAADFEERTAGAVDAFMMDDKRQIKK